MLLSSMLQILNQFQPQPAAIARKPAAPVKIPDIEVISDEQNAASGLDKLQMEIAAAAGLLRPLSADPSISPISLPGPNLEELMQMIEKLKVVEEFRVIDVFE